MAALACAVALAAPGPVSAQEIPGTDGGAPQRPAAGAADSPAAEEGLPFTGVDLIALGSMAVALTSMGFALRRLATEPGPDS